MGEIGIPRHEFLYDLCFWEVRRIIRGYRNRDRLKHQLMAECAFAAMFAMRDPKGKSAADVFPSLFNDEDEDDTPPLSEEEVEDLQDLMNNLNDKSTKD